MNEGLDGRREERGKKKKRKRDTANAKISLIP